ncbi:efflux RND transporter periplasmic adaptor subunit [Thermopirellula anaerolimosa]
MFQDAFGSHHCLPGAGSHVGAVAVFIVLSISLTAVGCRPPEESTTEETLAPVPVKAVSVARRAFIPTLDLIGQVTAIPERVVDVCAKTTGWVDEMAVTEGDRVRTGDLLIRLDPRPAEIELARTKAVLQKAEAHLARLRRGFLPQEVAMAEQQLSKAREDLRLAEAKCEALRPLFERGEIPPLQMEEAEGARLQADAAVREADAKLELYKAGTPPEEIAEAEAQVAEAQAQAALAQLDRDLCTVTSPCDAMVSALPIRRGMAVDKTTPLITLMDLSHVFVEVRVPGIHAGQISIGSPAEVRDLMDDPRTREGTVARLAANSDPATGDLVVRVEVENTEEPLLRPGMSCRVQLELKKRENVLVIPVAALADRSGTPVVTVIREDKAYEVPVTPGARTADFVEISSGLSEGDLVTVEGGYALPEGCPVRIANGPPKSP